MQAAGVYFPVTYSRLIARELQLDHAGLLLLLEGTSLTPESLFAGQAEISAADQLQLVRNALRLAKQPDFGLQYGAKLNIAAHGPLGQVILSSPTLGDAVQGVAKFISLRGQFTYVRMSHKEDKVHVEFKVDAPDEAVRIFILEILLAASQHAVELILGHALQNAAVYCGYPAPAYAEKYAEHLHSPVHFDAPTTEVVLPAAVLAKLNPFSDPESYSHALSRLEKLAEQQKRSGSWSEQVRAQLKQGEGQLDSLIDIANRLHMSSRTLMRYLKAEGTSYRQLVDEELRERAHIFLASPRHTVESVAAELGYEDASAFRRAFKRWEGISPQEYITRHGLK
ncbi:MAG TPA: AraC family transcriptional regulator ligand-binding domain-containing protein [Pseudomonadales bacterium]|nr:AraC family transcriptional regulator ligand-binding domain-containing protein [Pseudomonadales bacterium]